MKAWTKLKRLSPRQRRAFCTEKYIQIERTEYGIAVERRRRTLEEETARITREHNQRMAGNVHAPGLLERALLSPRTEYLRTLGADRIEIRKRLGQECPDLLSPANLDALEEEMISTVGTFRVGREEDAKRRYVAAGLRLAIPANHGDAEYGDVVGIVRREVQLLRLRNDLGHGRKSRFTRDQKIAIAVAVISVFVAVTFGIVAVMVPEVRRFIGLDKAAPTAKPPAAGKSSR